MSNLLKRARTDIRVARTLLSPEGNPDNDSMITDQAAYHIQQGIEKALKYQTEINGAPYKKIHNLAGLIADAEKTGLNISAELKMMSYKISDWEASSRYNDDFSVSVDDLETALRLYDELEKSILDDLEKKLGTAGQSPEES